MTKDLQVGDVVQIDPEHSDRFGGCFMIVSEPKPWGAQGYIKSMKPGNMFAYLRLKHEQMVLIGRAEWSQPEKEGEHND